MIPPALRLAGLGILVGYAMAWGCHRPDPKDRIALENALAELDSTRKVAAGRDSVWVRALSQQKVTLSGVLAQLEKEQRRNAKLQTQLKLASRAVDTTVVHAVPPAAVRKDSLVLDKPPVLGQVNVAIHDSTVMWAARLRPAPVDLTVGVTCSQRGPQFLAHAPSWIEVELASGQIDPAVCHPKPSRFGAGVKTGIAVTVGGYITYKLVEALLQ